jgi:AraC-like DNA-binding protein
MGVAQCVFILVYIASRSWRSSRSIIPFLYFLLLGSLFFGELFLGLYPTVSEHRQSILMFSWMVVPVLSYLFIVQIINLEKLPALKHYMVLPLTFLCMAIPYLFGDYGDVCNQGTLKCALFYDVLITIFVLFSTFTIGALLFDPDGFRCIRTDKDKKDRYWLALTIILINAGLVASALSNIAGILNLREGSYIRIILGVAYAYLATTSLFRIYPPSIPVEKTANPESLNTGEKKIINDINRLMTMDKLYQEPAFSRADLARELNISEGVITKVINAHYGKNFPTLVNEARVEEAKHLLVDTDMNIKTIADDVGFNSIATFNRVFKDIAGQTATEYRNENAKSKDPDSEYILG